MKLVSYYMRTSRESKILTSLKVTLSGEEPRDSETVKLDLS